MPTRRCLFLTFALAVSAGAGDAALAQAPQRPRTPAPLPPATIDNRLAIGGEDIAARMSKSRMTVEVRVNGQGPYRFVVDSGADTSVVGQRIAQGLRLPPGRPATLNGVTAISTVDRVLVDQLSLGSSIVRDLELPVLLERDLGGDGMIGIDALVQHRLMMDFETRTIKVEDARQAARMVAGEIVVTARRRRGQLILTEVRTAGLAVDAVIDTGSEITIGNLALRDRLIRGNRDKFVMVDVIGVTGVTVAMQLARIGELRLGPVTLRDVPMAFADVPPFATFGLSRKPALLLGSDLLQTFRRVSLDFRARKVRFQLRRCDPTGVLISTAPTSALTRLSSDDGGVACRR